MNKIIYIVAIFVGLSSCRGRQIVPGKGAQIKTIVATMEHLDRPKDLEWFSENVELNCRGDHGETLMYAIKYTAGKDEDIFFFEPATLVTKAKCRLKIKITSKHENFGKYLWQSIPEEPGLLYISDFANLQSGKVSLKVYKAFQLKTTKKTHISLESDDCYAEMLNDECSDIRAVTFPTNLGPWWAVVYGRAVDDSNTKQQVIVAMRQGPMIQHQKVGLTIHDIIDDLNKVDSKRTLGYFKIGLKEKLENTAFEGDFLKTAGLEEAKLEDFKGFKPLHFGDLKGWGYQVVEKSILDEQSSARWFVSLQAEKNDQIVTAIVGGIGSEFLSAEKPRGTVFYADDAPFALPLDPAKHYKAYKSEAAIVSTPGSCSNLIDQFLDHVEWSYHFNSKRALLQERCAVEPSLLRPFYEESEGWSLVHEYWLEYWHSVM